MTKEQSLQIKGVAILMMLYVHLFSSSENVELCTYFLNYGSTPLVQKLTRCTAPVPFFLIVSGYGFYKQLHKVSVKSHKQRIWALYKPYWLINVTLCACAILFLTTEFDLRPNTLFYNVVGLKTTYNPHCWFVLPYILLSLGARKICRIVERTQAWRIFLAGLIAHLVSYGVLDWYEIFLNEHCLVKLPVNYCYLLFPFLLGTLLGKYNWNEVCLLKKVHLDFGNMRLCALLLLLLVIVKINVPGIANPFYAIAFVFLFNKIQVPVWLNKFLHLWGGYSLEMWFIHGWLIAVFLHSFLFDLRYPLVIYSALIGITFVLSYLYRIIMKQIVTSDKN